MTHEAKAIFENIIIGFKKQFETDVEITKDEYLQEYRESKEFYSEYSVGDITVIYDTLNIQKVWVYAPKLDTQLDVPLSLKAWCAEQIEELDEYVANSEEEDEDDEDFPDGPDPAFNSWTEVNKMFYVG